MPWDVKVIAQLDEYFRRLLVPKGVDLQVNGRRIEPRAASLTRSRRSCLRSCTRRGAGLGRYEVR